jgi:hypothetical protein
VTELGNPVTPFPIYGEQTSLETSFPFNSRMVLGRYSRENLL